MLFSDTIICPACRYVLDPERAQALGEIDDLAKSRSEQIPCRNCGEANQIGLVRCWNCSAFLREDIQEAYYQMIRGQREITYSQPGSSVEEGPSGDSSQSSSDRFGDDDDDDFELSGEYAVIHPPPADSQSSDSYNRKPSESANPSASNGSGSASGPKEPTAESGTEETKSDQPAESSESRDSPKQRPEDDPDAEDHSVATGGDVLLDIALTEEKESEKVRKRRAALARKKQKQRKQRGGKKAGKGDASPERLAAQKKALARRKAAKKRAADKPKAEPKYGLWLDDVRKHRVNPQKLKLKPGSEENQFEPVDVGVGSAGVVAVSLAKKPGLTLFQKSKSSPEETRKEIREHLEAEKPMEELPAPSHEFIDKETAGQFKVVQPAAYAHESMFAGVPVFGEGRIAVRLPVASDASEHRILSFWLTEFRQFSQALEQRFSIKDFGHLEGVPLTDPILDLQCHYSENPLKPIDPEYLKFYEADPAIELELIGRRCEGCGLAVSEEARRKEKIGGLRGKSIAKAKCPKCEKKFGSTSLYQVAGADKNTGDDAASEAK